MKRILLLLIAAAALSAPGATNITTIGVVTDTNGVLRSPMAFFQSNAVLTATNFSVAVSNSFGWDSASRTLTVSTNFQDPAAITNGLPLLAVTNLVVRFGTNVLQSSGSSLVINGATGRTETVVWTNGAGTVTNTLRFQHGLLVDP